jgi:hypothetical protein
MTQYNLFLDDFRSPYDCGNYMLDGEMYRKWDWTIVRNHDEFVDTICAQGLPEFISFDHDLADEHYSQDMYKGVDEYNKNYEGFKEKTGLDCAKWLVDYCIEKGLKLPKYRIHSMNPAGGKNIFDYLQSYEKFSNEHGGD